MKSFEEKRGKRVKSEQKPKPQKEKEESDFFNLSRKNLNRRKREINLSEPDLGSVCCRKAMKSLEEKRGKRVKSEADFGSLCCRKAMESFEGKRGKRVKSEQKPKPQKESDFFKKLNQKGGDMKYLDITDIDQLPTLISLSKHALKTYNQNNNNQGPTFMFHQFVQSTFPICRRYSITFEAKAEGVPSNSTAITTFEADVEKNLPGHGPPTVFKCAIII